MNKIKILQKTYRKELNNGDNRKKQLSKAKQNSNFEDFLQAYLSNIE